MFLTDAGIIFAVVLLLAATAFIGGTTMRQRARLHLGIAYAGWFVLWGMVILLVVGMVR
jgi:hypothetical protein